VETSCKSIPQIERDLGIGKGCLYRWWDEFEAEGTQAFPGQGRLTPEQEELRRLKRENEILRQERDILKKQWPSSRTQANEVSVHRRPPGRVSCDSDVQGAGCVAERVLRLA
jgi:transposase